MGVSHNLTVISKMHIMVGGRAENGKQKEKEKETRTRTSPPFSRMVWGNEKHGAPRKAERGVLRREEVCARSIDI